MTAGLARHATGVFEVFGARRSRQGTRGPLPYVADHVVEPVAICGKGIDRRGALVSIQLEVLPREPALPSVSHCLPLRSKRFAPREGRAVETAAGCEFPFAFERQLLSSPGCVCGRILVGDVNDRMVIPTVDGAVRTL